MDAVIKRVELAIWLLQLTGSAQSALSNPLWHPPDIKAKFNCHFEISQEFMQFAAKQRNFGFIPLEIKGEFVW